MGLRAEVGGVRSARDGFDRRPVESAARGSRLARARGGSGFLAGRTRNSSTGCGLGAPIPTLLTAWIRNWRSQSPRSRTRCSRSGRRPFTRATSLPRSGRFRPRKLPRRNRERGEFHAGTRRLCPGRRRRKLPTLRSRGRKRGRCGRGARGCGRGAGGRGRGPSGGGGGVAERGLAHEMERAREIQARLLPETMPNPDRYEIAARYIPAAHVGGDYYDVIELPTAAWRSWWRMCRARGSVRPWSW